MDNDYRKGYADGYDGRDYLAHDLSDHCPYAIGYRDGIHDFIVNHCTEVAR